MAQSDDPAPDGDKRLHLSRDSWISEKRGLSRARDPKTGQLLDDGEDERPPRLRRVLRGKKSRPRLG